MPKSHKPPSRTAPNTGGTEGRGPAPQTPVRARVGVETPGPVDDLPYLAGLQGEERTTQRALAQAQLASLLEITRGDAPLPHQVSEAEFAATVEMLTDIRAGDSDLQFASGPWATASDDVHREAVLDDLATLLSTRQGRGLVHELAYSDDGKEHTTTIYGARTPDDAGAKAPFSQLGAALDGTGADALVFYDPHESPGRGPHQTDADTWAEVMPPDMVLFHELVHARAIHRGELPAEVDGRTGDLAFDALPEGAARSVADRRAPLAEYHAVGLAGLGGPYSENRYRAERSDVTGTELPHRDSYFGTGG